MTLSAKQGSVIFLCSLGQLLMVFWVEEVNGRDVMAWRAREGQEFVRRGCLWDEEPNNLRFISHPCRKDVVCEVLGTRRRPEG